MTNEIQELKNSLFSHYLLQDHIESNKNSTSKGVMHSCGKFVLNGSDILGHRHPLYLKALVDCLELPTEMTQDEALTALAPTIEFIKTKAKINLENMAIINTREDNHLFWRKWDCDFSDQSTITIPLTLNTSLLFSEHEITRPSLYISSLAVAYQNRITKLFKEQSFLERDGRVHKLTLYLEEKLNEYRIPAIPDGLSLTLEKKPNLDDSFLYINQTGAITLQFPVAITNAEVDNIFQILKGLL